MAKGELGMETVKKKSRPVLISIAFMLIMLGFGVSESSRGVFSTIFETDLQLTKPQVSWIVTAGYVGNLVFMLLGGRIADRFDRKKVCIGIMGIWTASQLLFALTDNYGCLLAGMFFSLGASTLMNTVMNILSPFLFGSMAGFFVNILFFVQGIGLSANQKFTGTYARNYGDFSLLCGALGISGILCLVLLGVCKFRKAASCGRGSCGEEGTAEAVGGSAGEKKHVTGEPAGRKGLSYGYILAMGAVFGFYFVAEHGILNWWAMYCQQGLGFDSGRAGSVVALFYGTMTAGRLLFAPFVQRLGCRKSIAVLGGLGSLVYILGILMGGTGVWVLGASGIFLSVIYPTIVLFLQELFHKESIATATGMVISVGTLFDIGFNGVFGSIIEAAGFGVCLFIFPAAIALFYAGFLAVSAASSRIKG